jgi:hypothetical protein
VNSGSIGQNQPAVSAHPPDDRAPAATPRRIALALSLLAAVGILRILFLHFVSEPRHEPAREPIDLRYQALRPLLPPGEAGYVSDQPAVELRGDTPTIGTRMYLQAQFALAPVVLRYDDARADLVVANLADPAKLPDLLRSRSLVLVAEPAPGLAIARPR